MNLNNNNGISALSLANIEALALDEPGGAKPVNYDSKSECKTTRKYKKKVKDGNGEEVEQTCTETTTSVTCNGVGETFCVSSSSTSTHCA